MSALITEPIVETEPTPTDSPAPERVPLAPPELEAIYHEHSRPIYYLALRDRKSVV